jgi:putative membrane protein
MSERVWDSGLQAERTALAWRRTSLAMAVAAVGAGRLAAPALGVVAIALAGLGLIQAVGVSVLAHRRYGVTHRSLLATAYLTDVPEGGLPMASLALSGLVIGGLAVGIVLGSAG